MRLAEAEDQHENFAAELDEHILTTGARAAKVETARRLFLLQYGQPGLAGLLDG